MRCLRWPVGFEKRLEKFQKTKKKNEKKRKKNQTPNDGVATHHFSLHDVYLFAVFFLDLFCCCCCCCCCCYVDGWHWRPVHRSQFKKEKKNDVIRRLPSSSHWDMDLFFFFQGRNEVYSLQRRNNHANERRAALPLSVNVRNESPSRSAADTHKQQLGPCLESSAAIVCVFFFFFAFVFFSFFLCCRPVEPSPGYVCVCVFSTRSMGQLASWSNDQ